MPCDTGTVTVPAEPSATISSVNFTGGQNTGTFDFTIDNTGNVNANVDVEVTVTNADTGSQIQTENMTYTVAEGGSTSETVTLEFNFSNQTSVQVCATVTNVVQA